MMVKQRNHHCQNDKQDDQKQNDFANEVSTWNQMNPQLHVPSVAKEATTEELAQIKKQQVIAETRC
jgi:hypothetical protein